MRDGKTCKSLCLNVIPVRIKGDECIEYNEIVRRVGELGGFTPHTVKSALKELRQDGLVYWQYARQKWGRGTVYYQTETANPDGKIRRKITTDPQVMAALKQLRGEV